MMITNYFRKIEEIFHSCPLTVSINIQTEIVDINLGYFKAQVKFVDDSELHVFEFVSVENDKPVVEKYRYHYQDSKGKLVKRWDNAKHHPEIKTFPDHVHIGNKARESKKPEIEDVLLGIVNIIAPK